ncbi:MAG: hypothetical protein JKX84_05995 [Flavobacteriales bacterium]|nr:hypothetical protein [Flavobacteriales bacterium]
MADNQMFSYTITRYSPAWEIQTGKKAESAPQLSDHSKLFRKLDDVNVRNLKDLLYAKGFVPSEVEGMSSRSMENYLAENRLVMHYRIRYDGHSIFLAHLNNSRSKSVIPFLIENNKWILDAEFAETAFFKLIAKPHFNAYTGNFDGMPICDLAFEEVERGNRMYDYSGRNNSAVVSNVSIVDGRIGGAIKLGQETEVTIDLRNEKDLAGSKFSINFHVNVKNNIFNGERKRMLLSAKKADKNAIELFLENGFLHLKVQGAKTMSVPYNQDVWFHVSVAQTGKKLSLNIDGEEVAANTINSKDVLLGTVLQLGGRYSYRGMMDELRISK